MIETPDSAELETLCRRLADAAPSLEEDLDWPEDQLRWCGEAGVFAWFHRAADGGLGWGEPDLCRGYMALSQACLTTAFVITQRVGACRRIAGAADTRLKERLLPNLIRGDGFATVGISHLTTSRQHLAKPILIAEPTSGGFRLNGTSPWITGGPRADWLVIGAALEDGRQVLVVVPTSAAGVSTPPHAHLAGLTASQTGPVHFQDVDVPQADVIAGPAEDVMQQGKGATTGGLQTSALALGLAAAAIDYLEQETGRRPNLSVPAMHLRDQWEAEREALLAVAGGAGNVGTRVELRQRANSLVLRATQAALGAAKGAGYVWGHPTNRWCREALFFLVWSCPQAVSDANLCELAQTGG